MGDILTLNVPLDTDNACTARANPREGGINRRFHVEFLERTQRELAPLVPLARRAYRERQPERRSP